MANAEIGVAGLAVMGKNLALNLASRGYAVAAYNRTASRSEELAAEAAGRDIRPAASLAEFAAMLSRPRKILLMVKAGEATDELIGRLRPLLEPGDVLIDGGNAYFEDTIRRARDLERDRIHFIGTGVSGGEEGALRGPAIMPGGSREGYRIVEPYLTAIAAKVDDEPCCAYIGPDGAGHYVKMVHNGIEYGDMELIGEAYHLLTAVLGLSPEAESAIFAEWNRGELDSYLIAITADILNQRDPDTGAPMVDVILDTAGQKGTGKWTSQSALDLGVPLSLITESVFARFLSAMKDERVAASRVLSGPAKGPSVSEPRAFVEALRQALFASKVCSYAQGFAQLRAASEAFGWDLDYGRIATLWRGGCIIRARFLENIKEAYARDPALPNLLLDPFFRERVGAYQEAWREVVATAVRAGVPVPAMASALAYFDGYRAARLPANLLQAQRDYFGAHTYERVDRAGTFHREWQPQ